MKTFWLFMWIPEDMKADGIREQVFIEKYK